MNAEQTAAPLPALSAAEETPLSHYEKKGAQVKGQRPECAAGPSPALSGFVRAAFQQPTFDGIPTAEGA
jgi:hypothetical protein